MSHTPATNSTIGFSDVHPDWDLIFRLRELASVTKIVLPIVIGILLLIGLVGNILVVSVTFSTKRIIKHPVHSILVLNLAVADFIYLLASAPYQAIYQTVPGWIYGEFLCPALHYLNIQTMAVSIFTMCSLALMRFMALMMPFKIQRSFVTTSGKLLGCFIIILVWTLAGVIALPNVVYFRLKETFPGHSTLECAWEDVYADTINSLILLVFTYVIPFVLVAVLYFIISRKILYGMATYRQQTDRAEYVRTTIMVFLLIVAFLVCWFPHHLYTMILVSKAYSDTSYGIMRHIIEIVGYCFSYAHACVNPIIYTFASPGFRRSLHFSLRRSKGFGKSSLAAKKRIIAPNGKSSGNYRDQNKDELLHEGTTLTTKLTSPTLIHHMVKNEEKDEVIPPPCATNT